MQLRGLTSCYRLLDARQRREYWIVALLATLAALMEMVGIAAIIPVITVLVDFHGTVSSGRLHWMFQMLGDPGRDTFLVVLALSAIAAVWLSGITSLLSVYASQRYLKRINADLAVRVYQRYMSDPIEAFYGRASSEFMRNVNGVSERVANGVIGASITAIARSIQILAVAAILFFVNFEVTTIILLVICGSYAVIFLLVRHRVARMSTENLSEVRVLQQLIIGSYQAYRSIVIDRQLGSFISHFRDLKKATSRKAADIEIIGSTPRQLIEIVGITLLILASYLIGRTAVNSHQFVAVVALFGIAAYRVLPSAQQLYNALNQITAALAAYRVVADEWGDLRPAPSIHNVPQGLDQKPLVVEAKTVSYAFGTKDLFNGLSVSLNLSGVIRVAGSSGVGKSTFIELLTGLRQPQGGEILLDGVSLTEQRRLQWWSRIAYVSQTDYIFEGTVRQNVVLDRAFEQSRLALVADICGLEVISRNGVFDPEQNISEAGTNLSGGQRSRILLARALYKTSDIMFLDEAFAALDVASAKDIFMRIQQEFPEKCLIVVSHRDAELPFDRVTVKI